MVLLEQLVDEHYRKYPTPHDKWFIYHGEPLPYISWFCDHCDMVVETEYCWNCDTNWSEAAAAFLERHPEHKEYYKENPAWQVRAVICRPCNFPDNGYLGHTSCQDDEHHWGYNLHISDFELYQLEAEKEWLANEYSRSTVTS